MKEKKGTYKDKIKNRNTYKIEKWKTKIHGIKEKNDIYVEKQTFKCINLILK